MREEVNQFRTEVREDFNKIFDKTHELEKTIVEHSVHSKNLTKSVDDIHGQMKSVNERLLEYNQQLLIHIQGVKELREMNAHLVEIIAIQKKETNARLTKLEVPFTWFKLTKSIFLWIATIGGGIATFLGLIWKFLPQLFIGI